MMTDGDLLPPGGGAQYAGAGSRRGELDPDDDTDQYVVCADCGTHMLVGDEDFCPICRKAYCEECFEDHDCGFLQAQAEARNM